MIVNDERDIYDISYFPKSANLPKMFKDMFSINEYGSYRQKRIETRYNNKIKQFVVDQYILNEINFSTVEDGIGSAYAAIKFLNRLSRLNLITMTEGKKSYKRLMTYQWRIERIIIRPTMKMKWLGYLLA